MSLGTTATTTRCQGDMPATDTGKIERDAAGRRVEALGPAVTQQAEAAARREARAQTTSATIGNTTTSRTPGIEAGALRDRTGATVETALNDATYGANLPPDAKASLRDSLRAEVASAARNQAEERRTEELRQQEENRAKHGGASPLALFTSHRPSEPTVEKPKRPFAP